MSRKLNSLQLFFIDNNLSMDDNQLAKSTGATIRQVKARRSKIAGKNREGNVKGTPEHALEQDRKNREAELINESQKAAAINKVTPPKMEPVQGRPAPAMRIDALIQRKSINGDNSGTTSMTGPASELADL